MRAQQVKGLAAKPEQPEFDLQSLMVGENQTPKQACCGVCKYAFAYIEHYFLRVMNRGEFKPETMWPSLYS